MKKQKLSLKQKVLRLISLCLFIPTSLWAINTLTSGYKTTTTYKTIDAHTICKQVKHNGSTAYFVPTKSNTEWTAFLGNPPSDITIPNCTYSWVVGVYSSCSRSCGTGTQTRTVVCNRHDGLTVADSFCGGSKPVTSLACNTHSCFSCGSLINSKRCDSSNEFPGVLHTSKSACINKCVSEGKRCCEWHDSGHCLYGNGGIHNKESDDWANTCS